MTRVGYTYCQKQMSHLFFFSENVAYSGTVGDFFVSLDLFCWNMFYSTSDIVIGVNWSDIVIGVFMCLQNSFFFSFYIFIIIYANSSFPNIDNFKSCIF